MNTNNDELLLYREAAYFYMNLKAGEKSKKQLIKDVK